MSIWLRKEPNKGAPERIVVVGNDYTSGNLEHRRLARFSPYSLEAELRAKQYKAVYRLVQNMLQGRDEDGREAAPFPLSRDEAIAVFGAVLGLEELDILLAAQPCPSHPKESSWGHYYGPAAVCQFCHTPRPRVPVA